MEIIAEKTKLMTNSGGINTEIKVNEQKLETVTSYKYLGSVISDEGSKPDILTRTAHTTVASTRLKRVWKDRSISLSSKIRLIRSFVTSMFLYACEIMDPQCRPSKKNTNHGIDVLPQDYTCHLRRPCYQRGSLCHDPAGNRTTGRPPDHRKVMQTAVIWTCLPFISRLDQNHLAKHSERGKKTKRTKEEVGRQHQGKDRPGVRQVQEGRG